MSAEDAVQTFYDGRRQRVYERCPVCGEMGLIQMGYAPDVGRNWYRCNKESGCGNEWV